MRILIIGINFMPELVGIGKFTGEMAIYLAQKGHDIRVVTAPPYYPEWRIGEAYSAWAYKKEIIESTRPINVYRCPLWIPRKLSGLKRMIHLASFTASSFPVMLYHTIWKPDVVLAVEPPFFCSYQSWLAARLSGAISWLHVQDFEIDAALDLGIVKVARAKRMIYGVEKWILRRFDRVSTISGRMLERLDTKGVAPVKQFLFANWVDTNQIKPIERESPFRSELGIRSDEIVALYSGNMGEKQGLETVIEAARSRSRTMPIRFVLCGQGAAYARLRMLAEGLTNIIWMPLQPAERLNDLLNLADIHLLPQRADAADLVMPSKLTGIMASGRPVVATANEGTEVWSVVQGHGITVAPGDDRAFVAAVAALAKDPARRALLGAEARKYSVEHLGKEQVLNAFEAALRGLVARAKTVHV